MTHWRSAIPALILLIGCVALQVDSSSTTVALDDPLASIPATLGVYTGRDLSIDAAERRVAGATDYLLRSYEQGETRAFSLYVGYYAHQAQGRTIHSPKNCLPGGGWETVAADRIRLPAPKGATTRTVNRVVVASGSHRALVYYWYQGRGRVVANEYLVKWNLLRDAAVLGRTEEALVRIVVPLPEGTVVDGSGGQPRSLPADRLAQSVVAEIVPKLERLLPSKPA